MGYDLSTVTLRRIFKTDQGWTVLVQTVERAVVIPALPTLVIRLRT